MEKEFVPYELAVKLKKLGFKEDCLRYYNVHGELGNYFNLSTTVAPLWQQAFDWFHKEYNLFAEFTIDPRIDKYDWCIPININKGCCSQETFDTYEEARLECLKKLIEIVENNK